MYDLDQDLIAALERLRALLEQPCPTGVLERLVRERQVREAARSALDLQTRRAARKESTDRETSALVRELGQAIQALTHHRSADGDLSIPSAAWLALEWPGRPSYGELWSSESGPPPRRAPKR